MFDIDHLYLARYNINKDGGYEFDPESAEGLQNSIIESILTILKDKKSLNILYKSIDNDTELVTRIADEIPEQGNTKSVAYNFGTLHEQVTRKNDYITGKTGIGPFALNVTNHILTTLYGVKFKESSFTQITGITGFDQILDEENNQISSWLSAFINAHVDIVKDPYISKLNVNGFTYNMINLLAGSPFELFGSVASLIYLSSISLPVILGNIFSSLLSLISKADLNTIGSLVN